MDKPHWERRQYRVAVITAVVAVITAVIALASFVYPIIHNNPISSVNNETYNNTNSLVTNGNNNTNINGHNNIVTNGNNNTNINGHNNTITNVVNKNTIINNINSSSLASVTTPTPTTTFTTEKLLYYDNSIGMEFVQIPSGSFIMGDNNINSYYDGYFAYPEHTVEFKNPFYMGTTEVTQKQWCKLMDYNPSNFKGDDFPVYNVSLSEVQEFIRKLNEKERTNKYRLPSEAEWEYACRAGTDTDYYFGNDPSKLDDYEWYNRNSEYKIHPVHEKNPNLWGLHDMLGNVREMTLDIWHDNYKIGWDGDHPPTNGSAWGIAHGNSSDLSMSANFVVRGGYWSSDANFCWSAYRSGWYGSLDNDIGFRLVREV